MRAGGQVIQVDIQLKLRGVGNDPHVQNGVTNDIHIIRRRRGEHIDHRSVVRKLVEVGRHGDIHIRLKHVPQHGQPGGHPRVHDVGQDVRAVFEDIWSGGCGERTRERAEGACLGRASAAQKKPVPDYPISGPARKGYSGIVNVSHLKAHRRALLHSVVHALQKVVEPLLHQRPQRTVPQLQHLLNFIGSMDTQIQIQPLRTREPLVEPQGLVGTKEAVLEVTRQHDRSFPSIDLLKESRCTVLQSPLQDPRDVHGGLQVFPELLCVLRKVTDGRPARVHQHGAHNHVDTALRVERKAQVKGPTHRDDGLDSRLKGGSQYGLNCPVRDAQHAHRGSVDNSVIICQHPIHDAGNVFAIEVPPDVHQAPREPPPPWGVGQGEVSREGIPDLAQEVLPFRGSPAGGVQQHREPLPLVPENGNHNLTPQPDPIPAANINPMNRQKFGCLGRFATQSRNSTNKHDEQSDAQLHCSLEAKEKSQKHRGCEKMID
eukprot:RCo049933